ncbi:hypothetical protein [Umezawaea sp. Da 62-37]|uniref:hypothetical protein n=1 Tax=Umezawaea sp. Da 62-37 TaxID=3075927 RepID=UPI0028F6D917|nr:hypothetical protein [Umezawaea sp. Da 62-37]WNV83277.1 hypothetical protein RM788_34560 [Umezawaea sp. Da 62-37]
MPIAFDTTGLQQHDQTTWYNPVTNDQVSLEYFDQAPDLPAALDDLGALRHGLAHLTAEVGCLVEAHVVHLGGEPALFQIVKLPIPNQPSGQAFLATFTVPRAGASAVLKFQAIEEGATGVREAVLMGQVGFDNWFQPHPYAPELQGKLPFHVGDDPRWDAQFPQHPLSRARAWAHRVARTGTVDPRFAALPPFEPVPEVGATLTTVVPGIPIGGYLPLWLDDDDVSYWRMTDPGTVLGKLGKGALARVPVLDTRFRDLVALDEAGSTIMLADRYGPEDGGMSGGLSPLVRVPEAEARSAVTAETVLEAFRWVGLVSEAAAERGEYVAVEPGGVTYREKPYVLMIVRQHKGQMFSVVETAPVPDEAPIWHDQLVHENATGQTMSGPASPETIRGGGLLAMYATTTWDLHPSRLCLSFGPNPHRTP